MFQKDFIFGNPMLLIQRQLLVDYIYDDLSDEELNEIEKKIHQNELLDTCLDEMLLTAYSTKMSKEEFNQWIDLTSSRFSSWLKIID